MHTRNFFTIIGISLGIACGMGYGFRTLKKDIKELDKKVTALMSPAPNTAEADEIPSQIPAVK